MENIQLWTDEIVDYHDNKTDYSSATDVDQKEVAPILEDTCPSNGEVTPEATALGSDMDEGSSTEEDERCDKDEAQPRPSRSHRLPERFKDFIMHQQSASTSWTSRADYLLSLVPLFPEYRDQIISAVIYIVSNR
jgi:hypothetical protein